MRTSLSRAGLPLIFTLTATSLWATPILGQESGAATAAIRMGTVSVEDVRSAGVKAADLAWIDVAELPGVQISYLLADKGGVNPYSYRLRLPAGYELRPHKHGARRYVTVLQGTYVAGFGETADRNRAVAFPAGSFVWIPKNMPHFAWTKGETVIQVHGRGAFKVKWVGER